MIKKGRASALPLFFRWRCDTHFMADVVLRSMQPNLLLMQKMV
jgi:hypothetical protein